MLLDFMKTKPGRILISVLWGFALSMLFRKTCAGNSCVTIQGPPIQETQSTTYDFGKDGCYKFQPHPVRCPDTEHTVVTM